MVSKDVALNIVLMCRIRSRDEKKTQTHGLAISKNPLHFCSAETILRILLSKLNVGPEENPIEERKKIDLLLKKRSKKWTRNCRML